jgi:hypothetical protein
VTVKEANNRGASHHPDKVTGENNPEDRRDSRTREEEETNPEDRRDSRAREEEEISREDPRDRGISHRGNPDKVTARPVKNNHPIINTSLQWLSPLTS